MKKLQYLLYACILAFACQSCTLDLEPENPFLGAWNYSSIENIDGVAVHFFFTYTFFDDGSLIVNTEMTAVGYNPQTATHSYKYEYDDKLILVWYTEDSGATFDYTITGNKMKWQNHYHAEEDPIVFTKE